MQGRFKLDDIETRGGTENFQKQVLMDWRFSMYFLVKCSSSSQNENVMDDLPDTHPGLPLIKTIDNNKHSDKGKQ